MMPISPEQTRLRATNQQASQMSRKGVLLINIKFYFEVKLVEWRMIFNVLKL